MAPNLSPDVHPAPASTDTPQFPASKLKPGEANKHTTVDDVEAAAAPADGPAGRVVDNYMARAQWIRAAVLGANDGLVSVASLMIGVGAVHDGARVMLVSGLAGLVAGACSMGIGEFVSVYAQCDVQTAHGRVVEEGDGATGVEKEKEEEGLPSPAKAAAASALAFAAGALVPLLAGGFVRSRAARVAAVCAASSLGLAGFGACLGGANAVRSGARVLLGGWLAMAVTYGVLKLFSLAFETNV